MMTPLGKWFNRPRRHSSPTSRLNEFMNISAAATHNKRNNTFPPTTTKSTTTTVPQSVPQRAPMLITTSFYNQAYPFEIYENEEASYHPTTTTQPLNIPIKNKSHHLEDDDVQFNSYRATNQRTPTPYHVSERYDEAEQEEDGKTFSGLDIAGFEKLQEAFKKLEKKHKKKEKKIQELEYLLYSKSFETQQQQQQQTKSSEYQTIPLSNSYYAGYYEPYYGYNYYSPSSYYYNTSSSHHHELRHTKQGQYRYDKEPDYYSQQQYYQRSTL